MEPDLSQELMVRKQSLGSARSSGPSRIHLGFIDALRALASLYVVIYHALGELEPYKAGLVAAHPRGYFVFSIIVVSFWRYGHIAVAIFIVISGFCLMLPL